MSASEDNQMHISYKHKGSLLDLAMVRSAQNHAGQFDANGDPYVFHPIRVMMKFKDQPRRIVAVLHDVIEDTKYTMLDMQADEFPEDIIESVMAITHQKNEALEDYWTRIKANKLAFDVKLQDIYDNVSRMSKLPRPKWREKLRTKYSRALTFLLEEETEILLDPSGKDVYIRAGTECRLHPSLEM